MNYNDVVTYTDRNGKIHLCEPAGYVRTVSYKGKSGLSVEEEIIHVLYEATFDAFVINGAKICRCQSNSSDAIVYIVDTKFGVYFVKSLGHSKYTIATNDTYGPSPFGNRDFTVKALMLNDNILLFILFDKQTKERASSYYYIGF